MRFYNARLFWEPRDLWIGMYWNRPMWAIPGGGVRGFEVYICLVPCFPLRLRWCPR